MAGGHLLSYEDSFRTTGQSAGETVNVVWELVNRGSRILFIACVFFIYPCRFSLFFSLQLLTENLASLKHPALPR